MFPPRPIIVSSSFALSGHGAGMGRSLAHGAAFGAGSLLVRRLFGHGLSLLVLVVVLGVGYRLVRRRGRRPGRRGRRGLRPAQVEYRECYLKGSHWAEFRHGWWGRHHSALCVDCGAGHPLDLHHLTYARRGHEADTDVVPVCRRCHEARHGRVAA